MPIEPLIAPLGGLKLDLPADLIASTNMSDCLNVSFKDGKIIKRYGYSDFGGNLPLAGPVIGSDQFYLFSGTDYLLVCTTKLLYKLVSPTSSPYWETINVTEVEDDCETTWTSDMGANGAVADETTIKKVGSTAQKISPGAGFTTGLMAHRDQALGDKSTYSFVRLWIRSSVAQAAGDLQFLIDDTAGCGSPTETLNIPALTADTWKLVFLEASAPATGMNAIASLGLKCATDNGACSIYIDDIQFVQSFSTSVAYNTSEEDVLSFDYIRDTAQTEPWWIMTNSVDAIKKWTGTGAISNLISSFPAGVTALLSKHVIEFKNHLLLLDVTEDGNRYPQRVRWSNTAVPADFLNGNASFQDLTGADWIIGGAKFKGDYIAIFKERSIWVGYATGDSDIFQFDQKVAGTGCAAGRTIESLGDEIIFLGWDDVYVFNGIDYESIGAEIREELFDTLNPQQVEKCFGVVIEEQKEYWLFVPYTTENYPNRAWIFNYELNKWTRAQTADYITSFGYYQKQANITIGDLVGTIGAQAWRIGDRTTLTSAPVTLFGDFNGDIYQYDTLVNNDDDTAIDAWFATKDFNPTQLQQRFIVKRIDSYFTGDLTLQYSIDKGVTWTTIADLGTSNDLYTPVQSYSRVDSRMIRLRWRNNTAGEHFEFSRANIYWEPTGLRI